MSLLVLSGCEKVLRASSHILAGLPPTDSNHTSGEKDEKVEEEAIALNGEDLRGVEPPTRKMKKTLCILAQCEKRNQNSYLVLVLCLRE